MTGNVTLGQLRQKFNERLDERERRYPRMPAILGDGNDTVEVSGRENYVYYRLATDGSLGQAYNNRVPPIDDLPVIIGYDALNPDLLQVLSTREAYAGIGGNFVPMVTPHHETHEFENDDGGYDVVWVQQQQIIPLMAEPTDPNTMTVTVNAGTYGYGGGWEYFDTTISANLTSYKPTGLGNAARFVGISINPVTNALQYTSGNIFSIATSISDPWQYVPALPGRAVPIAAILVTTETTSFTWDNIFDLRAMNYASKEVEPAGQLMLWMENEIDRHFSELEAVWIPRLINKIALAVENELDIELTKHVVEQ